MIGTSGISGRSLLMSAPKANQRRRDKIFKALDYYKDDLKSNIAWKELICTPKDGIVEVIMSFN